MLKHMKKDNISHCDLQKEIVRSPSCKSYELFSSQVITSEKVERQASDILESSSRSTDKSFDSDRGLKDHVVESKHKREAVRCQLANEKTESPVQSIQENGVSHCFSPVQQSLKSLLSHSLTELIFYLSIATHLCITILQYSSLKLISPEIARLAY
ncbi:hypothetical protein X975_15630, partial [Stegodyphus mimosarum]